MIRLGIISYRVVDDARLESPCPFSLPRRASPIWTTLRERSIAGDLFFDSGRRAAACRH
jgi:hypothetical protein